MLETLLAISILGTAVLAGLVAISMASRTADAAAELTTAQWISTSQIELIRTEPFVPTPGTYPTVTPPTGYAVTNSTSAVGGADSNLQSVTVTVSRGGDQLFSTSVLKVNR